jgi:hypothetical protein
MIRGCPGQEIGTHTFSHYYCLEPGQDLQAFRADLDAATRAAARLGIRPRSLVFPRNQFNSDYLAACAAAGLRAYRGNERSWLYEATNERGERHLRRAARLLDAYLPVSGDHCSRLQPDRNGLVNVPASRFLRPYARRFASLDGLRLRRITSAMQHAAKSGRIYHLWWHPHNFGIGLKENILFLRRVLEAFRVLAAEHGMRSRSMAEVADEATTERT